MSQNTKKSPYFLHLKTTTVQLKKENMKESSTAITSILFLLSLCCLTFISGCHSTATSVSKKESIPKGLFENIIHIDPTPVYTWQPKNPSSNTSIRIYIEGDGKAWVKRGRPSLDPTPELRLVNQLMSEDAKADIAYIARPCQYVKSPYCKIPVWTFDRYNRATVHLLNQAVDHIKQAGHYQQIELVGYSGGATIALLIAAQRTDIKSIRTVAGNLSPHYSNKLHNVSPMDSALSPKDFISKLKGIPQMHFYGTQDPVITEGVIMDYVSQFPDNPCIKTKALDASHQKGWKEKWKNLLEQIPDSCP